MQCTGNVIKKPFAAGSKSERNAVLLATAEGEYVLRRQGGNPFHDETLERLVGKRIVAEGVLTGYTLLLSSWEEAAEK
ncbi:MAG: hypothetical protein HYR56_11645 [Acidobacteria bacterium]|nr:hypothetical protein [Acidobacteriota bacterium]MBI3426397.1 hypothetical protein [Acidobacteriota bacterium]